MNNGTIQTTTSVGCVPTAWTSGEVQDMCKESEGKSNFFKEVKLIIEFGQAATENQEIDYPVCNSQDKQTTDESGNTESDQTTDGENTNESGEVINGGVPHGHILHFVGLALVGFFLVFMVTVCCYRRHVM